MKQDALQMSLLFDYYGELLSEKQRVCFDLYYNQDFSLSEIASELGITRQGVHDSLSRAETALGEFERVTGCIARDRRTAKALEAIADACERLQSIPEAREAAQNILLASASIKEIGRASCRERV